MFNRRMVTAVVVGASLFATAGLAVAKNAHHNNGHNLLGEKIHKNGKHEIGKIGSNSVLAEVSNDKVVGMESSCTESEVEQEDGGRRHNTSRCEWSDKTCSGNGLLLRYRR
jgi:hypothetical protein